MTAVWRNDVAAVRAVLALGVVGLRHTRGAADALASVARAHVLPDLTGEPTEMIVVALLSAIVAAHGAEWTAGDHEDGHCSWCSDLTEQASRYGDPTGKAWPDAVRRSLADVLDVELKRRSE